MKIKKIFSAFLAVMICTALTAVSVFADNSDKVVDNADLLSDSDEQLLESDIMSVIEKYNYGYDIAVVTVDSTEGKSAQDYADDYYDYNGYGYDSEYSGLLLLVDMGSRKWHISTCGNGINAFTDYGIERIGDSVASSLSYGDYYTAFSDFVSLSDDYINVYESGGSAYDVGNEPKNYGENLFISLVIGLVTALIVCLICKSQLKTAVLQTDARNYIDRGSFKVTRSRDMFLYKKVTSVKIESNSGGSGRGGSSTHRSSSGRSHGGGGGSF